MTANSRTYTATCSSSQEKAYSMATVLVDNELDLRSLAQQMFPCRTIVPEPSTVTPAQSHSQFLVVVAGPSSNIHLH